VSTAEARILDQGYRRYAGVRLGPGHAVRSVIAATLRRILGLHRSARWKILPVLAIGFAYLPAIVFVGVVALFNRINNGQGNVREVIPQYADYYGFIISAIVLFVTFVAPEALCPDRRSRVLSLYLASPLTRMTYLLAKSAAVGVVIAIATLGPPLLLLLGFSLQGVGPDGIGGFFGILGRIVASGALVAVLFTAVSTGIASLTDRKGFAAAATLLMVIGTQIVAGTWRFGLNGPDEAMLVSLTSAPFQLVARIYGRPDPILHVATPTLVLANLAWIAAGAATAIVRYQRLQVTR
jgi:ABC-2 type transport system permease protein